MSQSTLPKLVLVIIAIVLPPLAAFLQVGLTLHFFISIVLTLLMWLPGVLHALWLVLSGHKG
ncbi:MAG: YqaE/Pmp3 family membrane protein [Tepidisphaerales bacterium]